MYISERNKQWIFIIVEVLFILYLVINNIILSNQIQDLQENQLEIEDTIENEVWTYKDLRQVQPRKTDLNSELTEYLNTTRLLNNIERARGVNNGR